MKTKKETHGGSRPGSGRPKGEPTTTVSFRVKVKHKPKIVKVVTAEIKRLEGDGNGQGFVQAVISLGFALS